VEKDLFREIFPHCGPFLSVEVQYLVRCKSSGSFRAEQTFSLAPHHALTQRVILILLLGFW
jgi:hypothetical protein